VIAWPRRGRRNEPAAASPPAGAPPALLDFELTGDVRRQCEQIRRGVVAFQPWVIQNGVDLADALRGYYPATPDSALAANVLVWMNALEGAEVNPSANYDPVLVLAVLKGAMAAAIAELVDVELAQP
jgi:hypothetical protein